MHLLFLLSTALAVPQQLSQQGRLLESDGTPIQGAHILSFTLYESLLSSQGLWTESLSIFFTNGYYTAVLGSDGSNLLDSELLSTEPLYLELQIDSDPPLQPRQKLSSAPYSRRAGVAESLSGGSVDAATVAIGGALVIDSSGSWVGPTMALNWSDLAGIPAGFADGIDNDTQITEAEIETFVSNDPIDLALGSSVDTRSIVTQETPCSDGQILIYDFSSVSWICGADKDTNTQLSAEELVTLLTNQALVLANGTTVGGNPVLTESSALPWAQLTNVPSGLDDGDDEGLNIQCADGEILTSDNGIWICSPFNTVIDADGDGALTWNDCDDSDPSVGNQSLDADCDGILSGNDCDDNDPSSTILAEDGDCDGLLAADDCNDSDSSMPSNDADCDGTLTADDCNDADESMPSNDADCDGTLTGDDCDDNDSNVGNQNNDSDCDGYTTATDCDDNNANAFNNNGLSSSCSAAACSEILSNDPLAADGVFFINPDGGATFEAYCDMTTDGGGWTMLLNLDTSDGHVMWWANALWTNTSTYGELSAPFEGDHKSSAFTALDGTTQALLVVHENGAYVGWKSFSKSGTSPLYSYLQGGDNTLLAGSVLNSDTSNIWEQERLVQDSTSLYANHCVSTGGGCTSGSTGSPDGDRIGSDEGTPSDNNGGGLGNWHDMHYCCSGQVYAGLSCNGSAFRTVSEAQAGWAYSSQGGTFGSDSYGNITATQSNGGCSNANWAKSSGIDYDYALFFR